MEKKKGNILTILLVIMAVGDDAQSIYSFRGANYRNILDFPKMFEGTKIIKLEQNYRSTQNILKLTNTIISKAKEKYAKTLFSNIESPVVPALICAKNTQMEADFICQRILELLDEDISLSDICVLARNARMSYSLEIELSPRHSCALRPGCRLQPRHSRRCARRDEGIRRHPGLLARPAERG